MSYGQGYGYGGHGQGGYGGGYGQQPGGYGQPQGYGQQQPACPPGIDPTIFAWFQAVDEDRSGRITASELRQALINNNMRQFNPETCRLMIGMFDKNKDGTIDVKEFASLWNYIQQWRQCFDGFDQDRSGNIDSRELHTALTTFGYRLSTNFCDMIVRVFDKSSRNSIDFDYFIQVCVTLHTLTDSFRKKDTQQQGRIQISYEEFMEMVVENALL